MPEQQEELDEYQRYESTYTWDERRADVFWDVWVGVGDDKDCWRWLGSKDPLGRGYFHYQKRKQLAHRVAWQLQRGPIPEGMLVCHFCDVRDCCNPKHLFLGTNKDNTQDMILKGRANFGGGRRKKSAEAMQKDAKLKKPPSKVVDVEGVSSVVSEKEMGA